MQEGLWKKFNLLNGQLAFKVPGVRSISPDFIKRGRMLSIATDVAFKIYYD
jgi:hypothetical protein